MSFEIIIPEMGEGVIESTLTRWLVQPGDEVTEFQPVAEIETDKVTTELLTEVAGVVKELRAAEGETVAVDSVVAIIGEGRETALTESVAAEAQSTNGRSQAAPDEGQPQRVYAGRVSPVVGRIAAEHAVDLNQVAGTGKDGRITKRDILAFVEARKPQPDAPPAAPVETETVIAREETGTVEEQPPAPKPVLAAGDELLPLDGMRRAIAQHMVHSKHTSPHVTTVFEFDFSAVSAHRGQNKERFLVDGARLTYTVYLVSAIVQALKAHPLANSMWTDEGIVLRRDINLGMAVAIPDGLIVPVIKGADGLSMLGLARAINDLTERAREMQLNPEEVQGGTFTITNHGTSGSLLGTPIINQPQAGILGIGKIEKRVKVIDDAIAIRPLAYVSFTFDHRILDGATADAFVNSVKARIENWA